MTVTTIVSTSATILEGAGVMTLTLLSGNTAAGVLSEKTLQALAAIDSAADTALFDSGMYINTAGGLAATVDGEYFSVPSPDADEFSVLYLNSSGTAVEQKRFPTAAMTQAAIVAGAVAEAAADFAFDTVQGFSGVSIYDTKALATAAGSGMADQALAMVLVDESLAGIKSLYRKESGSLVFKQELLTKAVVDAAVADAETAEAAAIVASEVAAAAGKVYVDTAAGIAATTNGQYFWVPSASDAEVLMLYRNVSGVASDTGKRTHSKVAVDTVLARLPTDAPVGYAWSVYDGDGYAAVGVKEDGTFAADVAEVADLTATSLTTAGATFVDEAHVGFVTVLVTDPSGNAAAGVKDDGTLAVQAIEAVTMNGLPVTGPASRYGGAYPYQIGFINNTGESLAEGSTGTAITTAQEYDSLCWPARTSTGGVFLQSSIANGQYAARGENPMFGTQAGWKQLIRDENGLRYQDNDFKLLACNNGYSGYKIAQISKGQAPFTAMIAQATALQAYAAATGKSVGWLCNVLTIGANDGNPADLTATATFKSQTLTLASDLNTDVRAVITSQTRQVVTIVNQLSSRAPQLAVAQLECSHESQLVVLAGPMYQYSYYDALHINPASERAMGALCGLVAKRVITDGVEWEPLQPMSHIQVGASIYLRFNRSGLTIDTSTLPAQTRYGFDCIDSGGAAVAQSADPVVTGRDTLKLTFASEALASTVVKIRAGHAASTGRSDSFVGGSTNLRATASLMTFDAAPVYDWCVIFSYSI